MPGIEVFISYSRHDQAVVVPVVQLLRLGEHDLVFLDLDGIRPGERWRERLDAALQAAQYVVLFWCEHASRSDEVAREYEAALAGGKSVVPVLLDRTPLPPALAAFQWIDFTALRVADHGLGAVPPAIPMPAPQRPPPPPPIVPPAAAGADAFVLPVPRPASPAAAAAGPDPRAKTMADRIREELIRRTRPTRP